MLKCFLYLHHNNKTKNKMKKATTTITERDYIIISKGLSHLMDEYKNDKKIDQKYIKEIENLKLKLVEPFNGISMNNSINKNTP